MLKVIGIKIRESSCSISASAAAAGTSNAGRRTVLTKAGGHPSGGGRFEGDPVAHLFPSTQHEPRFFSCRSSNFAINAFSTKILVYLIGYRCCGKRTVRPPRKLMSDNGIVTTLITLVSHELNC